MSFGTQVCSSDPEVDAYKNKYKQSGCIIHPKPITYSSLQMLCKVQQAQMMDRYLWVAIETDVRALILPSFLAESINRFKWRISNKY